MLAFDRHGGRLETYNDGHTPETFRFLSKDNSSPKIVKYGSVSSSRSEVHVYDNVLNPHHARMLYDATAKSVRSEESCISDANENERLTDIKGESPWGTYVTIEEALDWIEWTRANECEDLSSDSDDHSFYEEYRSRWMSNVINFSRWRKNKQNKQSTPSYGQSPNVASNGFHQTPLDMDSIRHLLAVEAVAKFFLQTIPIQHGTTMAITFAQNPPPRHETLYQLHHFLERAHGVAVWALSSQPGQSVQYHIDYAELLRYEYNVTVPPLYAATVQCSELCNDVSMRKISASNGACECDGIHECCGHCKSNTMTLKSKNRVHPHMPLRCEFDGIHECSGVCNKALRSSRKLSQDGYVMHGGEFCVNLRGLEHYSMHGYKGCLSGDEFGGWKRPIYRHVPNSSKVYRDERSQWVTIDYAFNRGICHSGDLPHLSAPIDLIGSIRNTQCCQTTEKSLPSRVIVGFNVFGYDVGEVVAKAPEHSRAFRRKVKMYRATAAAYDKQGQGPGLHLSQVAQNKALAKLLVMAKREKAKQQFKLQQDELHTNIMRKLLKRKGLLWTVSDVMNEFASTAIDSDGLSWPSRDDVHVQLHHMILDARPFCDADGTAGVAGAYYKIVTKTCQAPSKTDWVSPLASLDLKRVK